ncbi:hypothetical protein [Mucilaginibacter myungsuensis]|uniref:Lipoprotein n=1 Tax=Mucilaginibacter myungsuensis TaxID=649104 RepID=A0A929KUS8_9SPHI|nr:hypothetical protein [Mucilaginibacter myungsuensis]MBE9661961.1 hypothetical protein [Mucilaginibacter myungsuensis]MDN3599606.1 hypothetical protein [Mucilaginibacter myungsuensis]
MNFKNYACIAVAIIALAGCKKSTSKQDPTPVSIPTPVIDPPKDQPTMIYTDLSGKSLKMQEAVAIDLNKDGKNDVVFYTQYVADNLNNIVKLDFMANSVVSSFLNFSTDATTGDDILPPLNSGQVIHEGLNSSEWYNVSAAVVMRRVENSTSRAVTWRGNWTDKGHLYLPIQVTKEGKKYYGWIEFEGSSQQEKLIFYKAAIATEADKPVLAGQ